MEKHVYLAFHRYDLAFAIVYFLDSGYGLVSRAVGKPPMPYSDVRRPLPEDNKLL